MKRRVRIVSLLLLFVGFTALVASATAVITVRAIIPPTIHHSGSYYFSDVSPSDFAAEWIGFLREGGVTTGCGVGRFCPNQYVTRREMAVFLSRQSAMDVALSAALNDDLYFDGYWFGWKAVDRGEMTEEDVLKILAWYDWLTLRATKMAPGPTWPPQWPPGLQPYIRALLTK
jgi:hypothetical protein